MRILVNTVCATGDTAAFYVIPRFECGHGWTTPCISERSPTETTLEPMTGPHCGCSRAGHAGICRSEVMPPSLLQLLLGDVAPADRLPDMVIRGSTLAPLEGLGWRDE